MPAEAERSFGGRDEIGAEVEKSPNGFDSRTRCGARFLLSVRDLVV